MNDFSENAEDKMSVDEFILEKKRDKFNRAWEKLIRLFDPNGTFDDPPMSFCRKKVKGQYEITCTTDGRHKLVFRKDDFRQAFVYYKEYAQELAKVEKGLQEKKNEGNGVIYYYKETAVDKQIEKLTYERRYIWFLLGKCGCDLKTEIYRDNLRLASVGKYIKELDVKRISSYYYEFKHYGIKGLTFIAKSKKRIDDVLFGDHFDEFRDYCTEQNIKTIYELLVFPYYSRSVVEKFSAEKIQQIIQMVIGTIEIILIDVGGINFDLTDFE